MELVSRVVAVGECMLELSRALPGGDAWRLRHGGDTLNTAVYLARLGEETAYLTALGTDSFSDGMRRDWAAEGIDIGLVLTHPDRLPGLYLIETDGNGERRFHYWRDRSAARALFACVGAAAAIERAAGAELLYLSGITLSLFAPADRATLVELCQRVRGGGGQVAFDPNYRPRGWSSPEAARAAFAELAPLVSIALPTFEDEALLHGDATPERTQARWLSAGADEVAIKLGVRGAAVGEGGALAEVPAAGNPSPRDTTGAGDAFNAAYLVARRQGRSPATAAAEGNALAAAVIRQPGAIIPRATMPLGLWAAAR